MDSLDILVAVLFIVVCVMLVIVILLQKGRGGGLGAAFGGSSSSAFGTRIGDVFTWITIVLTALFLLLAISSRLMFKPDAPTPVVTASPPPNSPILGPRQVALTVNPAYATVYYTLDGSDPMNEDTRKTYSGPFEVEPGTTVRTVAEGRGKWSTPYVFEYPDLSEMAPEETPETPEDATTAPADGDAETPAAAPTDENVEEPATGPADADAVDGEADEEPTTAPATMSVTG
jgi:preprotein translocase subunit SecG